MCTDIYCSVIIVLRDWSYNIILLYPGTYLELVFEEGGFN